MQHKQLTTWLTLIAVVAVTVTGCGKDEPTAEQLHQDTLAATSAAKSAMESNDPRAAHRAAAQATDAANKLRASVDVQPISTTTSEPLPAEEAATGESIERATLLAEAEEAALDAKMYAELTTERRDLDKQLGGLKAKTYRGVRGVAVKGTLKSLAFAARQADKVGLEKLPEPVQKQATAALDFVRRHAGETVADTPGKVADKVDWGATADKLDAMAEHQPATASMTTATSLMLAGQFSLALIELETVDPDAIEDPDEQRRYRTLRGFAYRMNGYPRLAHEDFRTVSDEERDGEKAVSKYGPQMQAGMHMLLFTSHIQNGELIRADRELARATRAWPNNPMTVFLTGEKLTAAGDYERAATSLEAWAEKVGDERIAARVAEHARLMKRQSHNHHCH